MKKLLVMDKLEYKERHNEFLSILKSKNLWEAEIVYTTYEDERIRKVRNYKVIGSVLQHLLYWKKSFDYAINILCSDADEIYCLNPIVAIFLGVFNKDKKIVLGGFLFEPKKNRVYYTLRRTFTKLSLRGITKAVVYGSREVEYYEKIFKCSKFYFVKYGIDYDNETPYSKQPLPKEYIFSGGGSNRDYKTLIEAYNHTIKDIFPLVIATQPWRLEQLDTSRILVLSDVVVETFGGVMGKSALLVLSLRDAEISTGHMVMFQAMSQGVPVLVNDIPAIRDYADEKIITFYRSEDTQDLCRKIEEFATNRDEYFEKSKAAKKKYDETLNLKAFLERFISL